MASDWQSLLRSSEKPDRCVYCGKHAVVEVSGRRVCLACGMLAREAAPK